MKQISPEPVERLIRHGDRRDFDPFRVRQHSLDSTTVLRSNSWYKIGKIDGVSAEARPSEIQHHWS